MQKLIAVDRHGSVAIVRLDRGVTNALNHQLIDDLAEALRMVQCDASIRSVVLTSSNDKFFSIGFDIPELFGLEREQFRDFYEAVNRACIDLYTSSKPTVAAISGHAIAGGCVLALCCDERLIAAGKKLMGLNEVKLGVPVPYPADCMLNDIVGTRNAREIMDEGAFYGPDDALRLGLVNQIVTQDEVLTAAIERAELMGSMSAESAIKLERVEPVVRQINKHLEEKQEFFLDRWYSDAARALLKEAIAKF